MSVGWITNTTIDKSKTVATVLHALTVLLTGFRLWFRLNIQRFWWEDAWASLALLFDVICLVGLWIPANISSQFNGLSENSSNALAVSIWFSLLLCPAVVWSSRMSVIFSVIRIISPTSTVRRFSFGIVVLFATIWASVTIVIIYLCHEVFWDQSSGTRPSLPYPVGFLQISANVFSDIILVIFPLRLLWRVKLPKNERLVILLIFSSSILTSVVSVSHAIYLFPYSSFKGETLTSLEFRLDFGLVILSNFEAALSLVICNLLVIVTFLYRIIRKRLLETDYRTSRQSATHATSLPLSVDHLTTIDLESLTSSPEASSESTDPPDQMSMDKTPDIATCTL